MTFYVMLNDGTLSWIKFYFESMKEYMSWCLWTLPEDLVPASPHFTLPTPTSVFLAIAQGVFLQILL